MRVLAVGATGQFAGLVVPALVAKGLQVRALVHDPAKADRVRELGATETVAADLRDRASVDAALDGVEGGLRSPRLPRRQQPHPGDDPRPRPRTLDSYLGELAT